MSASVSRRFRGSVLNNMSVNKEKQDLLLRPDTPHHTPMSKLKFLTRGKLSVRVLSCCCVPSVKLKPYSTAHLFPQISTTWVFMILTLPELRKWMSSWVSQKSALEKVLIGQERGVLCCILSFIRNSLRFGHAFFYWSLFLLASQKQGCPFLVPVSFEERTSDQASEPSKCSGQLHTHNLIL